ncbi:hypothetical protein ACFWX8_29420, partial [Streptomyces violascens]
ACCASCDETVHVAILEDADVIYLEELVARLAGIPALIPTALSLLRDAHAHLRVHVAHMVPEGAPIFTVVRRGSSRHPAVQACRAALLQATSRSNRVCGSVRV